jgi:hypothetical protein
MMMKDMIAKTRIHVGSRNESGSITSLRESTMTATASHANEIVRTARSNVFKVHRQKNCQSLLIVDIKIEKAERRIRSTRKGQNDGKRSRAKRRAEGMKSDDQKTRTIETMTLKD